MGGVWEVLQTLDRFKKINLFCPYTHVFWEMKAQKVYTFMITLEMGFSVSVCLIYYR